MVIARGEPEERPFVFAILPGQIITLHRLVKKGEDEFGDKFGVDTKTKPIISLDSTIPYIIRRLVWMVRQIFSFILPGDLVEKIRRYYNYKKPGSVCCIPVSL